MLHTPTTFGVTNERLRSQWSRAGEVAMEVFHTATASGTEVFAAGASYGFFPKTTSSPAATKLPRPGFHPLLDHTGQTSAHAALAYARSLDGWLDRLAKGCIPFLRGYKAALPVLQGPLSFCMLRVELDIPHKATIYVNGTRVDVSPFDFLDKAQHLQPAVAAFGTKNDPVSAHSAQEAVEIWELARI